MPSIRTQSLRDINITPMILLFTLRSVEVRDAALIDWNKVFPKNLPTPVDPAAGNLIPLEEDWDDVNRTDGAGEFPL